MASYPVLPGRESPPQPHHPLQTIGMEGMDDQGSKGCMVDCLGMALLQATIREAAVHDRSDSMVDPSIT